MDRSQVRPLRDAARGFVEHLHGYIYEAAFRLPKANLEGAYQGPTRGVCRRLGDAPDTGTSAEVLAHDLACSRRSLWSLVRLCVTLRVPSGKGLGEEVAFGLGTVQPDVARREGGMRT